MPRAKEQDARRGLAEPSDRTDLERTGKVVTRVQSRYLTIMLLDSQVVSGPASPLACRPSLSAEEPCMCEARLHGLDVLIIFRGR